MSLVRRFSVFRFFVVFAALTMVGAACSGTGSKSSTAGGGGKQFTIGFTNPLGSNDQLTLLQNAIIARAKSRGAKVIALDDQLDVDKQVSDIDQLRVAARMRTRSKLGCHSSHLWRDTPTNCHAPCPTHSETFQ